MKIRQALEGVAAGLVLMAGAAAHASVTTTYSIDCDGAAWPFAKLSLVSFNLPIFTPVASASGKIAYGTFSVVFPANASSQEMLNVVQHPTQFTTCELIQTVVRTGAVSGAGSTTKYTWTLTDVTPTGLTGIGTNSSNTASGGTNQPTALMQLDFRFVSGDLKVTTK